MKIRLYPITVSLMLALAACVSDYSKSEAPNTLGVDSSETRVDLAFAPGSARLTPREAARLERLVATGAIKPADRVTIAVAGSSGLGERRAAALSSALLRHGIVADMSTLETVPANHAIIGIGRYAVTLPPCPNWSKSPTSAYTNALPSNWGCARATNLGLMVASPADLVSGRTLGPTDGTTAVNAIQRYHADRVKQPPAPTAQPFAAPTGGDTGGAPGGAPGTGAGVQ
jgi:pilus assembly protein CpaD